MLFHAINNANTVTWIVERLNKNDINYYKSLFISNSVEKIFGYPKEKYLNDPMFYINNNVLPKDRDKLFQGRKKLLKLKNLEEKPYTDLYKIITASQEIRWIESTVTEIMYNSKKHYIFLEKDITEKQEKEKGNLDIAIKLYKKDICTDIITETTGITLNELKKALFEYSII